MRQLTGDFPGACCVPLGETGGVLLCRPDTPENASGNLWYAFLGRLSGDPGRQEIELEWPDIAPDILTRSEYGRNENFSTALDRTIHSSTDGRNWRPVDPVQVTGRRVRFAVELGSQPLYVSVGMPYLPGEQERLYTELSASPFAQVTEIARTLRDRPVRAIRIGPEGAGEGTFYLQGLQHRSEWAGGRILSAMARYLVSDAARSLRERFVWRLVPVTNVDGLYGWQENPPGNMNRDWGVFQMPEAIGVRDHLQGVLDRGERLLYAMDMHMGWSRRESAGSCLTIFPNGVVKPEIIETLQRLTPHIYAHADWTDAIWRELHTNGKPFSLWAAATFGIPAQTAEFSRHLIRERASGAWVRVTQAHEEALGRDLAQALGSFDW